jgi:hypothetical protein
MVGNLNVSGTTTGALIVTGQTSSRGGLQVTGQTNMSGGLTLSGGSVEFSYSAPIGPNAWSTGGSLITARRDLAGAGTQNAGLAFGGVVAVSCTEEYNGSSWSTGGALITGRRVLAGAGTQNAGLAFGGSPGGSCTEEYNGTSWSAGGALITARQGLAGAGTQDAGLAFGGYSTPSFLSCTEEYNGTAWSAGGALSTARYFLAGAGTQNAGLAFGGQTPVGNVSCTEEYNGSSWLAGGALITVRCALGGAGTQDAGLAFGGTGSSPTFSCTEEYNGSSWSAGAGLINARCQLAGAGEQNAGLAFGGLISPGSVSCTEEYSPTLVNTKTFEYSCTTGGLGLTGTTIFSGNTTMGGDLNVSGTTKLLTVQSGSSSSQVLVYNTSTNTVERRSDAEWISGGTINGVGWSATTTSPTVGTFSRNVISYKQIGPKEWEVNIVYEQSSGGSGGSGDYIFTLPNNLSFDTTIPSQQIYQSGVTSNSWANGQDALAASGIITDLTIGSQVYPVIWTATTFRIFAPYPTTSNLRFWGSSFYGLTGIINMKFSFIST